MVGKGELRGSPAKVTNCETHEGILDLPALLIENDTPPGPSSEYSPSRSIELEKTTWLLFYAISFGMLCYAAIGNLNTCPFFYALTLPVLKPSWLR